MRWLPLLLAASACKPHEHEHPHGGGEGPGPLSVTVWTDHGELFMEYPPLAAGAASRFAVHLTAFPSFAAVSRAEVTVSAVLSPETTFSARADAPRAPGIFGVTLAPSRAGACTLRVDVTGPELTETFDAGPCEVHASAEAARAARKDEGGGPEPIAFLKEQQWKTEFATAPAGEREIQPAVAATGEIEPAAGRAAVLAAPVTGRFALAHPPPILGSDVRAGQVLATIAPLLSAGGDRASLDADVRTARAEREAARAQLERAERLLHVQAVPEKSVEEARARAEVADARLSAAESRLAQYSAGAGAASTASAASSRGAFQVRAPLSGSLVAVEAASGEVVEEGKRLFSVIDLDRVWLKARVFEPDIPKVLGAKGAAFTIEGYDAPFQIDARNGRLITVGQVIDPGSRTVPVIFEVANPDRKLRIGQFAKVRIAAGAPVRALAIPESAIVEESGKPVAFVQVEGEGFERRPLTLGARTFGWAAVLEGVKAGERVVTKGAYEIRLQAASGAIPAHGHVH